MHTSVLHALKYNILHQFVAYYDPFNLDNLLA